MTRTPPIRIPGRVIPRAVHPIVSPHPHFPVLRPSVPHRLGWLWVGAVPTNTLFRSPQPGQVPIAQFGPCPTGEVRNTPGGPCVAIGGAGQGESITIAQTAAEALQQPSYPPLPPYGYGYGYGVSHMPTKTLVAVASLPAKQQTAPVPQAGTGPVSGAATATATDTSSNPIITQDSSGNTLIFGIPWYWYAGGAALVVAFMAFAGKKR